MNRVDEIYKAAPSSLEFAKGYGDYLATLLKALPYDQIDQFTQLLLKKREEGKQIFFIGNGGSAATASHFANDFSIGPRTQGISKNFKAISLTDNVAIITAIGNDFGYDYIFSKQLETLMLPGDVLVAISASGNSPNIIKAIEYTKTLGNTVVGLSGFDGGKLRELSDIRVHVQTAKGEYGPVEDAHMFVDHLIGSYLLRAVKV